MLNHPKNKYEPDKKQDPKEPLKSIFWGSSEEGARTLQALIAAGYNIVRAYTASGDHRRKSGLTVTEVAKQHNIDLHSPSSLKDEAIYDNLCRLAPQLSIVAAYGNILPQKIVDLPTYGTLNIHPSLLPKHRGASPVAAAIMDGSEHTGVSVMLLNDEMDAGPILAQSSPIPISPGVDRVELQRLLFEYGTELLVEVIPRYVQGELTPRSQDHSKATYSKLLQRADGLVNWQQSCHDIERQARAYSPWPGTYTHCGERRVKLLKIKADPTANVPPGEIHFDQTRVLVGCGAGAIEVQRLQLDSGRAISAIDFQNGYFDLNGKTMR